MRRLEGKNGPDHGSRARHRTGLRRGLCAEGARVAIGDIDTSAPRRSAGDIGAAAIAVELDVTRQESIDGPLAKPSMRSGGSTS
jgi:hypothetical protein